VEGTDEFAASKQFWKYEKSWFWYPWRKVYVCYYATRGMPIHRDGSGIFDSVWSKHSMHSDASKEIAHAGEFFVRRRRGKGGIDIR